MLRALNTFFLAQSQHWRKGKCPQVTEEGICVKQRIMLAFLYVLEKGRPHTTGSSVVGDGQDEKGPALQSLALGGWRRW